jgi:hypothetical protein
MRVCPSKSALEATIGSHDGCIEVIIRVHQWHASRVSTFLPVNTVNLNPLMYLTVNYVTALMAPHNTKVLGLP